MNTFSKSKMNTIMITLIILSGFAEANASTTSNLVQNGDFSIAGGAGWTATGRYQGIQNGEWYNGAGISDGIDTLSQTLSTIAGNTYTLSYILRTEVTQNFSFVTNWGGATINTETSTNSPDATTYTFANLLATSNSTVLSFSGWNNPKANHLSYVNVTQQVAAVPVPAAVWLFGTGLLGLTGFARKDKAA
ncbi:VPLPA-CTERM sorting domain-containing protein [Methylobacter sp. S3L5C]|uniref:VPLPA-CTERM sorting domain-containing protein n=1 Tax=Methylobacter sp. S3L5C TaxID=2839024 RepID=UPI001FAD70B0|nr:VPLPA-CTERM sorting domain-containing protein [Methylobacter sp. S3L5C]UOA08655.1 VPLPA-CTERM sorting domain-containing protein [Methylobacter sp. S3L5C]